MAMFMKPGGSKVVTNKSGTSTRGKKKKEDEKPNKTAAQKSGSQKKDEPINLGVRTRTGTIGRNLEQKKTLQKEVSSVVKRNTGGYLDALGSVAKRASGDSKKANEIADKIESTAAKLQAQGQKENEQAKKMAQTTSKAHQERVKKEGIGAMGIGDLITSKKAKEKVFDVGDQALQMGMDIAVTGGRGTLAAMGARAFGAEKREALNDGATRDQAELSAAGNAAVEVLTEKMFGANKLLKSVMGKGAADEVTDMMVRKFVGKLSGKGAKNFTELVLSNGMGAVEEGLEELVAEGLQPRIANLVYANGISQERIQNANQILDLAVQNGANSSTADRLRDKMDKGESVESVMETLDTLVANGMNPNDAQKLIEMYAESQDVIRKPDYANAFGMGVALGALGGVAGGAAEYGSARVAEQSVKDMYGENGQREIISKAMQSDDAKTATEAAALNDELDRTGNVSSLALDRMFAAVQQQRAVDEQRAQSARVTAENEVKKQGYSPIVGMNPETGEVINSPVVDDARANAESKTNQVIAESAMPVKAGEAKAISRAIGNYAAGMVGVEDAEAFTFEHTEARAIFERMTGQELPVVMDKKGNVDVAATNAQTKDAIYGGSTSNYVDLAKKETQLQVEGVKAQATGVMYRQMGAKGQKAYDELSDQIELDNVREDNMRTFFKDSGLFLDFYSAGRNGNMTFEAVRDTLNLGNLTGVSEDVFRAAYEAGTEDKKTAATETKAKGDAIRRAAKENASGARFGAQRGQLIIDIDSAERGTTISASHYRMFRLLAESLNINIHLVSGDKLGGANGQYMSEGELYLNASKFDTDRAMEYIFAHELTHHIKVYAPEEYRKLENLVRSRWKSRDLKVAKDGKAEDGLSSMESAIHNKQMQYKNAVGQELSAEDALEEIIADSTYEMLNDADFAQMVAEREPSLGQAMVNAIKQMLANIRDVLARGLGFAPKQNEALLSQLDILKEAEMLWLDAVSAAKMNSAAVGNMSAKDKYSLPESEIQERDEHIRVLEQDAEESYGEPYTEDFNETGYILSNAKLLKMGDYGERMEDHNTILQLYDDISYATSQSPKADAMSRFLNEGHIRIMPEANSMEFGTRVEPTYQQYDQIWAYADDYGVDTIEFTDPSGKTVAYREYDSNPGGRRLYDDIKAFYQNGSLPKARFSIKEMEWLDALGVGVTESGSLVRYSLNSWEDTDVKALEKMLVEAGYEESEVKKWIKNVNSVAAKILQDPERLNYTADEDQKALKDNDEYYYTLDLSTLCAKRRMYQGTYNAVMHRLPNKPMMPEDTIRLRRMMADMGYEVPCGICYEESRKKNEGKFAERWQQKYREENPDAYIPNLDEVTTTDGRERLKKEHPEALESYLKYQRTRGSANPKVSFTHTDYRGDILRMTKGDIAKVKHIGGLRIQSFSDFEIPHVIDMMQAVMDMASMKLTSQAYTKVPAFANIFGGTGIKINLSLIGKVNAKGKLEFDAVEGIDPKEAFKLRKKYSENVGTIIVGADDASILAAWADPRIDMVIPFHRSGWAISEFKALGLGDYQDYQNYQSERYLDGSPDGLALGKAKKAGLIDDDEMFYSIDYWDYSKTGKENAERYLQLCAENNRRPVFYNFLEDNGDGTWSLKADGSTDGYWKSLVDFKMYNNDGVGAPQQEVKPVFDMRAANKVLTEYEGGADTLPVAQDVVEKFVAEAGAKYSVGDNAIPFSLNGERKWAKVVDVLPSSNRTDMNEVMFLGRNEDGYEIYMDRTKVGPNAWNRKKEYIAYKPGGNVIEFPKFSITDKDSDGNQLSQGQREFFKDSKATDGQGNLAVVYHTTDYGGFTVFDAAESDDEVSMFFTSDANVSASYAGGKTKRKAYKNKDFKMLPDSELKTIDDVCNYLETKVDLHALFIYDDEGDSPFSEKYDTLADNGANAVSALREYLQDLKNGVEDAKAVESVAFSVKGIVNARGLRGESFDDVFKKITDALTNPVLTDVRSTGRYDVYLNLVNPLIVECNGLKWNEIPFDGIKGPGYYWRTRDISVYAKDHGYDGVIFRDVLDKGSYRAKGADEASDVYVAFDSDQIKLTDNQDPTNNPDIRFSLNINDEYLDLNEDEIEDLPPADKRILESLGRREETKREIISRTQNLYKSTRYTKGESIDPKSVERQIRELVMETMANSETKKKYKQKLVKQAVDASKLIYKKAKQDDFEAVADIAYDTAAEIVENLDIVDDTLWNQYRELREFVRKTPVALTEEDKSEIPDYADWRKSNFGRIKISDKGLPIDMFYQELSDQWPEMFSKEVTNPADQAMRISEVLDELKPYEIAYSSEEADALTREIAGDLTNITFMGKEWQSYADKARERYNNKTKALKMRHKEAIRDLRTGYEKKMADKDLAERMASGREMAAVKRQGEERISGVKAANKITIDNLRASRDAQIRNLKQNYKRKEEAKKNARERAKSFGRIKANYDWLTTRLLKPTDDKHIPYGFEVALADVLRQLDLQTERSKGLEEKYGVKAKNTLKLEALRVQLEEISKEDGSGIFEYDGYVFDLLKALENRINGKSVDSLTDVELRYIDTLLKSIRHSIANINKAFAEGINENISQLADKTIAEAETRKARTEYGGAKGMIDQLLNESTVTPRDFFELMGGGLNDVYLDGLRAGMDRHIEHIAYLRGVFDEIFSPYNKKNRRGKNNQPGSEIEKWRDSTNLQEFTLESGQVVSMSPAQIMSLYCLMKRQQAVGHIRGNGITLTNISTVDQSGTKFKQLVNAAKSKFGQPLQKNGTAQRVSDADLQNIVSALTPEQMQMADRLQKIVSEDCSKWGNETSLQMYGYEKFTEANYFPIVSSKTYLASDYSKRKTVESIKNFGFTKGIVAGANNPIVIDDIFTVVADHCNKMSLYNAFAAPIADFTRVMNYKVQGEDGLTAKALQAVIQDTYGSKAVTYINNFLADIQTQQQTRHDGMLNMLTKSLANYKRATIGANLRVALQQPTAVVRSFLLVDPKYFRPIKIKDEMQDMIKHCPIAAWKSWGHNQVDMARDIDAIMMNQEWTRLDAVTMEIYGALDNVTWAHIWAAVKNEVKAKNPNVSVGSEEFYELCNKRASEVFDKTQVVDSVFHRSQGMRNTEIAAKMMTSFMAEPTRTYNMMRTAYAQARAMAQAGDKKEAGRLAGKATTVFLANAMVCGAAAAVADAIRDQFTGDDDDKDYENFFEAWYKSFIENSIENANPLGMIPFAKDIWQLRDWDSSNMAYEGWESLMHSIKTLEEVMVGKSKSTPEKAIWECVKSIGLIFGVPIKNGARELEGLANLFGITWRPLAAEKGIDLSSYDASADSEMRIKDGSWIDNLMNKFGAHLTSEEQMQKDVSGKAKEIQKKCEGTSGREYDKKLYNAAKNAFNDNVYEDGSKVTFASAIEHGDYKTIELMRQVLAEAGGDVSKFDEDVLKKTKSVFKANIGLEDNQAYMQMSAAKEYLISQGWTQQDISSQLVAGTNGGTKCQTAKDFQVAFCENNQELTEQKLIDLCSAGLTFKDYVELVDNASRSVKAENYSTGSYDWPFDGQAQITKGYSRSNANVEIAMPVGTNVKAADGGKVTFVGDYGKYGQQVVIDHGNGRKSIYSHLDTFKVYKGQIVSKGDIIALSGNTGVTNGPSLGLKMYEGGSTIDPTTYL